MVIIEHCGWPLWDTATEDERVRYIKSRFPNAHVEGDGNGAVIMETRNEPQHTNP